MNISQQVQVFDSQTREYHHAFQAFLDHTDQKLKAQQWLRQLVDTLPARRVFIDVGAGNGIVTSWFVNSFDKTIAIEPNESLSAELKRNCPQIEVFSNGILDTKIAESADFVLCSHVFYYIDDAEWMLTLERLASLLSPEGVLVVILQNAKTDCMDMLRHFFNQSFDLAALARIFQDQKGDGYEVAIETVPAQITTLDFNAAYTVAEFMLNTVPITNPPARSDLEEYVRRNFSGPDGSFRFSCNQDFLQIRLRN